MSGRDPSSFRLLSLGVAAVAMVLASVSVIGNALRLRTVQVEQAASKDRSTGSAASPIGGSG